MTPATDSRIRQVVPCNCGNGYWRYLVAGSGLHMTQKQCPRCEDMKLIVFEGDRLLGVGDFLGYKREELLEALNATDGVSDAQARMLVEQAQRIADAAHR